MRPIALALAFAATTLLPGCFSAPCDSPVVTIGWELHNSSDQVWSCAASKTEYVDIYVANSNIALRFPCSAQGATIDVGGLPPGQRFVTVEGVAADGATIWSRDQFPVTVGDCNANPSYLARPGEGVLALDYHFSAVPAADVCTAAGTAMWYDLFDEIAGVTSALIDASTPPTFDPNSGRTIVWQTEFACGTAVTVTVPFGTFTLKKMQEVSDPLGAHTPVAEACNVTPLDVWTPGTTTSPTFYLGTTITNCP